MERVDGSPDSSIESLAVLFSRVERNDPDLLARRVKPLTDAERPLLQRTLQAHRLGGHLWHHLESIRDRLPPHWSGWLEGCRSEHLLILLNDMLQTAALQPLAAALREAGARALFVKGVLWHSWLYGEDAPPRGAGDLDLLVPEPEDRPLAVEAARRAGFQPRAGQDWSSAWSINSELPLIRKSDALPEMKLELHRAPSLFHVWSDSGQALMEWLRHQPSSLSGTPTLSPSAALVYLAVNLQKSDPPLLGQLNDLALLCRRKADQIQWPEIRRIGRQARLQRAIDQALRACESWSALQEGRKAGRRFPLRRFLNEPLRGGGYGLSWIGGIRAFGWRVVLSTWLGYEAARWRVYTAGQPVRKRLLYLSRRPLELASHLG